MVAVSDSVVVGVEVRFSEVSEPILVGLGFLLEWLDPSSPLNIVGLSWRVNIGVVGLGGVQNARSLKVLGLEASDPRLWTPLAGDKDYYSK